jgi:hypothetical protein
LNARLLLDVQVNPLFVSDESFFLEIKLKLELQRHLLNVNQNWLLESSTFLVQLASDFLLGGEIWLKLKLDWFVFELHQELVENQHVPNKQFFVEVDVLLNDNGLVSRNPFVFRREVKLAFVELCVDVLKTNAVTFDSREDLDRNLHPSVNLNSLVALLVELSSCPKQSCTNELALDNIILADLLVKVHVD